MANFEAFCWNFSWSTNPEMGRSAGSTKRFPLVLLLIMIKMMLLVVTRSTFKFQCIFKKSIQFLYRNLLAHILDPRSACNLWKLFDI